MNHSDPDNLLRVTLDSIGDAVIATDTEGQVTFLNAVAESLTGWSASDAVGQPLATVFRIINQHTRKPVENPVEKMLQLGQQIVGLADPTILIARDGTERPIDESAAPIRGPDERLRGVVLVFRDVTDRKLAEDAAAERHRITALRADVATALAATQPLPEGLQACCEALVRHLNMAFARVWTLNEVQDVLELQASAGRYSHLDGPHSRVRVGEFKIGRIAASRQPHLTNDVPHDPNVSDQAWAEREGMVAFAGYPLVVDDRVLGVLAMFAREPLTETLLVDLAPLADQIAQYVERKRAEERLRESELRYRLIGQAANDAIWDWNLVTNQVVWNEGMEARFGYTLEQIGEDITWWVAHIHADDRDRIVQGIHAIIGAGGLWQDEYRYRRCDGTYATVFDRGRVVRDENHRPVRMVGSMLDVSERKQAAEAAQRRSEQLRRLADVATRIGVAHDVGSVVGVVTEEVRHVIEAHQAVASMTAHPSGGQAITAVSRSEKYAGWKAYEAPPDGSGMDSLVCRMNRAMRLTQAELEAHPAWRRSGAEAGNHPPLRGWLAAPFVGRDGANLGLIQLSDKLEGDFTEDDEAVLVQLAQMASVAIENARLVESLRDADRRKDEFLATLAHELRNPLAPIRMGLEVMRLGGEDAGATEEIRSMMERQTQQLITLVDDLLDVSRITRGKFELRKCRVTLSDVVRSAVEASRPYVDEVGHELTVAIPDRPIHLNADPNRLAQVISNLLNNAAKYTPEGGQIRLTVERQGNDVVITVRDNGIGIPAEMQRQVFEMFAQIDRPMEKGYVGLGIGLTLVRSLVEMHAGAVNVRSEGVNQGSEFSVRLPILVEAPVEEQKRGPALIGATKTRRRVLVVDDNKAAADMLGMVVKMLGNDVRTAGDGREAVEVAAQFLPDVVLMDLGMPKLDGYEAAKQMRQQPWGEAMLLVALTGWGQEEDRQRTREAGFDHHLVKPAEPAELQRLLAALRPTPSGP